MVEIMVTLLTIKNQEVVNSHHRIPHHIINTVVISTKIHMEIISLRKEILKNLVVTTHMDRVIHMVESPMEEDLMEIMVVMVIVIISIIKVLLLQVMVTIIITKEDMANKQMEDRLKLMEVMEDFVSP